MEAEKEEEKKKKGKPKGKGVGDDLIRICTNQCTLCVVNYLYMYIQCT